MAVLVNRITRWKRLYYASPVWLQHVQVSAYGWLWKRQRFGGGRFDALVREYAAREASTAEEWQAYQTAALGDLLQHAFAHVPHYQTTFARSGLTLPDCARIRLTDLYRLPLLDKHVLRQAPATLLAETTDRRRLYSVQTSGTTGTPLSILLDRDAQRSWNAATEARWRRWAGVDRHMSRAMIGGRRVVRSDAGPPYWRYNWAERQVYLSAYHLSQRTAPHYAAELVRFKPDYLVGYATSLHQLARLIRTLELPAWTPRAVLTTSETLTSDMRSVLESVFHAPVFDAYGSVESCALATECAHQQLHVSPDVGIVELLDSNGRLAAPGQVGEIVATGLLNRAQPLVRYRTGDLAIASLDPCPCGRAMPILRQITGRFEDGVIARDGREIVRLHGVVEAVPQIREAQIIQEDVSVFRMRLAIDGELADADRHRLQARFEELLGPVTLTYEIVPQIERGANGKFRVVISKLPRPG